VVFLEKGKRRLANLAIPDVLEFPRVSGGYPTEKPVELCEVLVQQSTVEDEIVVDPFMGSAAAGVASVRNGRRFIGCDVQGASMELAAKRLTEVVGG
jgi:site-specific DNA-methyltransferase (adenine-specific)